MIESADLSSLSPSNRALLEEFLGTKEALLEAVERGSLSTYIPYPHQLRLHQSPCSTRFLLGANKIGKTWFLCEEIKYFCEGSHPYRALKKPAKLIWACCPTEELMLMYMLPGVRHALGEDAIRKITMGAHPRIEHKNGCIILFKYYAQGARAFPSASVDLIAFDEEPSWPIFEECWARRGTGQLNIVGALTTVWGITPLVSRIVSPVDKIPDCHYETASIWDNPAIPEDEKKKFSDGFKSNPVAYRIRVLGEILAVGGTSRFDANQLVRMEREDVREPMIRMDFDFDAGRWVQTETGRLWIWDLPEDGNEYVIGGDTAEGLNIGFSDTDPIYDNSSFQVFSRTYRKFVAEYTSGDEEPAQLGEFVLPRLNKLYNNAWANIELNLHGYTIVSHARKYMSERLWSPVKDPAERLMKPLRTLGTLMMSKARTYAVDTLAEAVHLRTIEVPSGHSVQEMMQFVNKGKGRAEHQEGAKDDRVFAMAHALVCDRGLPAVKIRKPPTIQQQLRKIAMEQPEKYRKVQWFRKLA